VVQKVSLSLVSALNIADNSLHISRNHGTRLEIFGDKEVYPQFTLFRGDDPRILFREITRELVHSHSRSGRSTSLAPREKEKIKELMNRSVN
jgi:hypothetical protein